MPIWSVGFFASFSNRRKVYQALTMHILVYEITKFGTNFKHHQEDPGRPEVKTTVERCAHTVVRVFRQFLCNSCSFRSKTCIFVNESFGQICNYKKGGGSFLNRQSIEVCYMRKYRGFLVLAQYVSA